MSNCLAFHTQIASIMEVLANAAVAEICQVVDDGYAVLRLEMSQYQKENKALKRKLQVMERQTARRCAERGGSRASFVDGAQVCRKLRETPRALPAKGQFPAVERALDNRIDVSLKRDEQPIVLDEEDAPAVPTGRSDGVTSHQNASSTACAVMEEGRTEALLIKEERLKENLGNHDCPRELRNRNERAVESEARSKGSPPSAESRTASAKQEQLPEQLAEDKRSVWEVSALGSGPEAERAKSLQHPGPGSRARKPSSLDSEFVMFERPGQLGSYCTQGGAVAETEDPCCSYSTGTGQGLSYHAEMRPFLGTEEGGGNGLSPLGSLDWKPDIMVVDPTPVKLEPEVPSAWNAGPVLGLGDAPPRPFEEIGERGEMLPDSAPNLCLPPVLTTAGRRPRRPSTSLRKPRRTTEPAPGRNACSTRTSREDSRVRETARRSRASTRRRDSSAARSAESISLIRLT
ncbi:hypothetical protein ANANG_G00112170 [Anguilla anguilla]|uniref:Uncharacterized protein n=1 Tax=Anguilla anguilla TaxID=7936 RepID=A0A9D3S020_ANGAN|nr:hypothetical protein ANANG_G00112170 [Anguilla anguilla]